MKLYYSNASPYARKVRIVAAEKNIPLELIPTVAGDDPPALHKANAIGKVPALLLDDGTSMGESANICAYLETVKPEPKLIVNTPGVLRRDAIGIGMMDALVRKIIEVRRPEDKQWQGWIDRQDRAIIRALDVLEQENFETAFTIDHVSVITALGYMDLRFSAEFDWRKPHPKLAKWADKTLERKSVKETLPQG